MSVAPNDPSSENQQQENGGTSCPPEKEQSSSAWRICVLCEPNPITYCSGHASRFRLLLKHFSDHFHETHKLELVAADAVHPSPPIECFDSKIPIHYTVGFCPPQYKVMTLSFDVTLKSLRVLFPSNEKFDLIHVSSPGFLMIPAIVASQLYQIPLLMSYHTHLPVYLRSYFSYPWNVVGEILSWWLLMVLHFFADLTLVTSPQIADEFRDHCWSPTTFALPLRVWRKGIDTDCFHPKYKCEEMRRRMVGEDGHPDDFLLVHIGRLGKEKRVADLKGILEELNKTNSTRLCIVGSGPEEIELREFFVGTPTVFLGRLGGTELSQTFASGDVFCMPSDSETLGFVVLESMASGVPVVAAKAGGPIDLIDDGTTGYLVPTGDIQVFADRIRELRDDPVLRETVGAAARKETERWTWYASMDEIRTEAYPRCVENFRSKRWTQKLYRRWRIIRAVEKSKAS